MCCTTLSDYAFSLNSNNKQHLAIFVARAIHSSEVSCRSRLSAATLHYRQLNEKRAGVRIMLNSELF